MIQLESLTLGYGQQILLDRVSASLDGGGLIALLGRNGSGKSTLLRATAGLGEIKSGRILLAGKDLAGLRPEELARTVSFVTTEKVRIPNLKCRDVVALGRAPYTNWVGRLQPRDREIVDKSLALLDMSTYAERTMDQMSDGECQRIMPGPSHKTLLSSCLMNPPLFWTCQTVTSWECYCKDWLTNKTNVSFFQPTNWILLSRSVIPSP